MQVPENRGRSPGPVVALDETRMLEDPRRPRFRRWLIADTEVTDEPRHMLALGGDNNLFATTIDKRTQLHASCVIEDSDRATAIAIDERTWPRTGSVVVKTEVDERPPTSTPFENRARYELGAMIGRGGMGEVFAAYDAQLGREVAIKRLHADKITPSSLARFLREARIQGWLDHPSIPSVYELGSDDEGRPFFVMKRLSGIALDEILMTRETPRRFTEQQLLRAFVEICLTVEFAHTRRVVHRDLKPANMLLGEFGEVYVLDWGVARTIDERGPTGAPTGHTIDEGRTAGVLGTPGYMAPEQVCGEPVDGRADVYALGCVLFEILAGRRLHPSGLAGMTSALAGVTASPSAYRDDLAPELDALCRRATASDRADRIPSARALGEAVQRYLDGDRDLAMRRELARHHLELARRARDAGSFSVPDSIAMREAGRALALDPALPGAAELVSRLMLQPEPCTPTAVIDELERAEIPEQRRMAKRSIGLYATYACAAPVLLAFGIRDVPYLCALVAVALGNIAIASLTLLRGRPAPRIVVAIGHAVMFGLIARMFTPLFLAPGVAALTLMAYAQHPTTGRRELLSAGALAAVAVLGVWGAEAVGWISSTTVVDGGVVKLVPPLDGAAQFPIVPALFCYSVLLVVVATKFAYSAVRRGRDARRELHVQAWRLRQLVSLDPPPTARSY